MSFIITPATPVAVQAIASGTIPGGATVIIKSDGTVAAVASSGAPQSLGSPVNFGTPSGGYQTQCCYDTANQAVVVFFADGSNSDFITAIVGTVSGTTITFGTKVVVKSSSTSDGGFSCSYDSVNQKVLFVYVAPFENGAGYAKVGTVSGTSISFGGEASFDSFIAFRTSCAYDVTSGKTLIAWRSSNTGPTLVAATISGTSVSFGSVLTVTGSPVVFTTSITYEPISGKLIYAYNTSSLIGASVISISGTTVTQNTYATFSASNTGNFGIDICNAGSGTFTIIFRDSTAQTILARAATVSGTTITWGSSNTTLATSSTTDNVSCAFDTTNNKIAYLWTNKVRAATVSGTTLTLETVQTINTEARGSIVFTNNVSKFTIVYNNNGSNYSAVIYTVDTLSTNLTANNFLGFSADTYASGAQGSFKFTGSVITGLTGLTAATKYYVQYDGTLATTADAIVGAVYAGIAISSTSLIMN